MYKFTVNESVQGISGRNKVTEKDDEIGRAEVLRLENRVSYQEGSVVSREIIRKPTGTVTIFAFDAGQGLSEHTAPFDALVYIVNGEAEVKVSGVDHNLQEGMMMILPANQPHALRAIKRFKMLLVMIRS